MLGHGHDPILLKRSHHGLSQQSHHLRIFAKSPPFKMLLWLAPLDIHHGGQVHVEPHQFHFFGRDKGVFNRFLHRLRILPYSCIAGELGERLLQPRDSASFLVDSEDQGETVVLGCRILNVSAECCQLNGVYNIPGKQDDPTRIDVPNQGICILVKLRARDTHHEKLPDLRVEFGKIKGCTQ